MKIVNAEFTVVRVCDHADLMGMGASSATVTHVDGTTEEYRCIRYSGSDPIPELKTYVPAVGDKLELFQPSASYDLRVISLDWEEAHCEGSAEGSYGAITDGVCGVYQIQFRPTAGSSVLTSACDRVVTWEYYCQCRALVKTLRQYRDWTVDAAPAEIGLLLRGLLGGVDAAPEAIAKYLDGRLAGENYTPVEWRLATPDEIEDPSLAGETVEELRGEKTMRGYYNSNPTNKGYVFLHWVSTVEEGPYYASPEENRANGEAWDEVGESVPWEGKVEWSPVNGTFIPVR